MGIPVKYKGEEREVGKGFLTGEFSGPEAMGKDLAFSAKAEERHYREQVTLAALVSGDPVARNAAAAVAGGSFMVGLSKDLQELKDKAEKESKDEWFWGEMRRSALQSLQAQFDGLNNDYDRYIFAKDRLNELKKDLLLDEKGEIDWAANAKKEGVLGDDALKRRPGETEEEYQHRIHKALFQEMFNPDGTPKDKYADSRFAKAVWLQQKVYETEPGAVAEAEAKQKAAQQVIKECDKKQDRINLSFVELNRISHLDNPDERNKEMQNFLAKHSEELGASIFEVDGEGKIKIEKVKERLQENFDAAEQTKQNAGGVLEEVEANFSDKVDVQKEKYSNKAAGNKSKVNESKKANLLAEENDSQDNSKLTATFAAKAVPEVQDTAPLKPSVDLTSGVDFFPKKSL